MNEMRKPPTDRELTAAELRRYIAPLGKYEKLMFATSLQLGMMIDIARRMGERDAYEAMAGQGENAEGSSPHEKDNKKH